MRDGQTASPGQEFAFLADGGETGRMIRARDWSRTSLGEPGCWPQPLKTLVSVLLGSQQPMFLAWGLDRVMIYNDGYSKLCGNRHPAALGQRFEEVWFDILEEVGPILDSAYAGVSTSMDDIAFVMHRNGYPEETHFSFSYTPVRDEKGNVAGMFCACNETTTEVIARRAENVDRERLSALFNQAPGFMAMLNGPDHRIELANAAYLRLVGDRDVVGRTMAEALPDAVEQGYLTLLDGVFASGIAFTANRARYAVRATPDGPTDERFVDFVYQPVTDLTGAVVSIFVQGHDVTALHLAQEVLKESEIRFRNMADHAPLMLWVTDATGHCNYLNRRWYEYTGQTEEEALGLGWLAATHPDDRAMAEQVFLAANAAREAFRLEYRLLRGDGVYRWAIDAAEPRFSSTGDYLGYVGSVIDIDERKLAEQHLHMMVNELNHRVKNSLATVQSIASQTFRNRTSIDDVRADFTDRIMALSHAHDLLTDSNWAGAALADVVRRSIEPHRGGGRFELEGPDVLLKPKAALALAMAVHELCTNAVKYGALSAESGCVAIVWSALNEEESEARRLRMRWIERGGPAVSQPTARGFGSRLVEYALAAELEGSVQIEYDPAGVICTIEAPLPAAD